ncbi:hypothetical protein FRC14_001988 [Serendipita sp. 396]|nr:hypothetical protein FRC14_001988 [Serendipita sp. 396]
MGYRFNFAPTPSSSTPFAVFPFRSNPPFPPYITVSKDSSADVGVAYGTVFVDLRLSPRQATRLNKQDLLPTTIMASSTFASTPPANTQVQTTTSLSSSSTIGFGTSTAPTSTITRFTSVLTTAFTVTSRSISSTTAEATSSIIGDESFVKIAIPDSSPCGEIKVSWWNGTSPFILSLFTSNATINTASDVPFARFNITRNTYSLPGSLMPSYNYLAASIRDNSNVYHDIQYRQGSLVVCPQASGNMHANTNNNNDSATSSPTHGLSSSSIKGIIIGVIASVVLLVIAVLVLLSRFKRKNSKSKQSREPLPRIALYRTLGRPSSRSTITSQSNLSVSASGRWSVKDDQDFASEKTPSIIESAVMSEMDMEDIIGGHQLQSRSNSRNQPAVPSHARHSSVGWDPNHLPPTSPVSELSPFDDSHTVSTIRPSQAASRRTLSQRTVDRTIAAALRSSEKGQRTMDAVDEAGSNLTRSDSDGSALPLSRQELEELADIVAARLNHRINVTTRSIDSRSRSSHGSDLPPRYA